MLYDPKWETEVKADPFQLSTLIAWAEKQPGEKEYNYLCRLCYLGQYFEDHGLPVANIGSGYVTIESVGLFELPPGFNWIAAAEPRTFGAALDRARQFAEETKQ